MIYKFDCKQYDEETFDPMLEDFSIVVADLKNFNKTEDELETTLDKWLYLLKHLENMKERPEIYNEPIFKQFFKNAEFMKLTKNDRDKYTSEHRKAWDHYAEIESGKKVGIDQGIGQGETQGIAKGKAEVVKSLLQTTDLSVEKIAQIANLSITVVEAISNAEVYE